MCVWSKDECLSAVSNQTYSSCHCNNQKLSVDMCHTPSDFPLPRHKFINLCEESLNLTGCYFTNTNKVKSDHGPNCHPHERRLTQGLHKACTSEQAGSKPLCNIMGKISACYRGTQISVIAPQIWNSFIYCRAAKYLYSVVRVAGSLVKCGNNQPKLGKVDSTFSGNSDDQSQQTKENTLHIC